MVEVQCEHCGYEWDTKSTNPRISCPSCSMEQSNSTKLGSVKVTTSDKYELIEAPSGEILHHRLIAVAKYGFDEVVENDVHHKNGFAIDNRPDNLVLLDHSDHSILHNELISKVQCKRLRAMYENGKTIEDLASHFDVNNTSIHNHLSAKCSHHNNPVTKGYDGPRDGPWRDRDAFKNDMVKNGMTISEMALKYGCSETTIQKWKDEHGIDVGHRSTSAVDG